jgi:hypothetical protein
MAMSAGIDKLRNVVKDDEMSPEKSYPQMRVCRSNDEPPKQFRDQLEAMGWILSVFNHTRA